MNLKEILKKEYIMKWLRKFQLIAIEACSNYFERIYKKDYIIGLDMGTSCVKIAQFAERADGLYLIKADLKEIKKCDNPDENENEILSALKYLFRDVDIKKSRVIVNINCQHTAIKKVTAPYMPKAELREGIRLDAKNYFPFPVNESLLDFEILRDIVEKGVKRYEVMVAVAPHKTVEKYSFLLEKAEIKPASLICTSYALQKIAGQPCSEENQTRCYIDIGEFYTELIIMKGKYLMFSREIPVNGSDFTKALTGTFHLEENTGKTQLSFDEAEKIKQEIGLPSEAESRIIDGKISTEQILFMLRAPFEQLISEIERCFDYYREESGSDKVESIILFGGGAALSGLVKYLSESLGIEVKLGNPLDGLNIEKGALGQRENIPYRFELAIASVLTAAKGVNLLPVKIKEEAKRVFKRSSIEVIAVGAVLVLILSYIGMKINLNSIQKRISVAKKESAVLEPQLKQIAILGLLAEEPYWDDVFKELCNIIPPDIRLKELSMENNVIKMRGIVNSSEPEQSLSNFMRMLEKGVFKNVRLITTKEIVGISANEFEIDCWIDEE